MTLPLPRPGAARPQHLRLLDGGSAAPDPLALFADAQHAELQGRRDEARELYDRALHALSQPSQARLAASILRRVAFCHQVDAAFEAALDCAEAARAISDIAGDDAGVGHALNHMAIVRFRQGRLDDAEQLYREARTRASASGDAKLAAMTAQNLGVVSNIRGDLDQALRHYEASLAEYRLLGLPGDVCVALNNLGMLRAQMGQWQEAGSAYDEAVHISTVIGDMSTRIVIETNIAELAVAQLDYDRAHAACERALALMRNLSDTRSSGEIHKVKGVIARERGELPLAEEEFAAAERDAEAREDALLLAETLRERAELHRRQCRNRDMLQCLNRAHRLFTQLKARRELADVSGRTSRLEAEFIAVVQQWGQSIESKDRYTLGHCQRVADVACALAERAGLDEQSLFWFRIGALLHDVGKILVPTEVLNKPGKLTDEEWELVKRHPVTGAAMLADIDFPWDVRPMVESHHERWDGGGYPHQLAGDDIPYTARILCIADVYDALTSRRSYRPKLSHEEAIEIMRRDMSTHFDPVLFAEFEEMMRSPSPAAAGVSAHGG